ncbi:MAG: ATP synthase F0 subunit B [Lachnospiraceae bacterium]|nr:ATP synthase F0 subunit B [Lachnospiraceae bacterium]
MLRIDINLIFTVINILVLAIAMKIFLFKPVKDIIDKRQKEADEEYEKATVAKNKADELRQQYDDSLLKLEEEKKETLRTARKNADSEYQRIIGLAESKAATIKSDAQIQAESTRQQVLKRAEREIADMVLNATEKMTGEAVGGKEINSSLYDEFLSKAGEEQ